MITLKCSRCTMLPTTWASRSYCLSFSGAFIWLVYSPDPFCEIGIVGGHRLGDRAAEQVEILGTRWRGQSGVPRVKVEAGLGPDIPGLVHAFEPKAPLVLLPGEERPAGEERRRIAARGDELDLRHQYALRVLLAEEDGVLHHRIHEGRAERAGEAASVGVHQVDRRAAVDLRAAEKKGVDAALAGKVEQLARAFTERVRRAPLLERDAEGRITLPIEECARRGDRRRCADRGVARSAQQPRDHAGEKLFPGVRTHSSR